MAKMSYLEMSQFSEDDKIVILARHLRISKEANASDKDDFDMEPTVRWEVSTREKTRRIIMILTRSWHYQCWPRHSFCVHQDEEYRHDDAG
jgi:hypothetical protein